MQKRYQVFVSSTYEDLKQERAEVMQALLELECMPAGMELFPASSEEQWSWIKKVIDESDYYVVIVAGRYGSLNRLTGLSYTEMEYQYAVEIGKPVIAFLHQEPEQLPNVKTESKPSNQKKLNEFRALCQTKLCKFWTGTQDLGAKVSRSVTQLQKHHPSEGWIKANTIGDIESEAVRKLKIRIEELQSKLNESEEKFSQEFSFADGEAEVSLNFFYETKTKKINKSGRPYWVDTDGEWHSATITWNQLLSSIGHELLLSPPEDSITQALITAAQPIIGEYNNDNLRIQRIKIETTSFHRVRTQFLGQGLIAVERVNDGYRSNYHWVPSKQAKRRILQLNADLQK